MRLRQIITMSTVALFAAWTVSCSTTSHNRSANERNLGVVELSPHVPKRVSLGHGKDCVITLTVLADGNYLMDISIETKTADGKTEPSCTSRLEQRPDQKDCGVTVGDTMIILTPKVRVE